MGTWSTAILGSDFASEVYGDFMEAYNEGVDLPSIRELLEEKNMSVLNDRDEGPEFWLALAKGQRDCGAVDPDVLEKVKEIAREGFGLNRWAEGTATELQRRKRAIAEFQTEIATPNPKAKKRRKPRIHHAIFAPGDCLALTLDAGLFGAALVLGTDNTHKTEGANLVGILRYLSPEKPSINVFEKREWLVLKRGWWDREKQIVWCLASLFHLRKRPVEKIGSVRLRWLDPKNGQSYVSWDMLGERVEIQFDREAEHRK